MNECAFCGSEDHSATACTSSRILLHGMNYKSPIPPNIREQLERLKADGSMLMQISETVEQIGEAIQSIADGMQLMNEKLDRVNDFVTRMDGCKR